MLSQRLFIKQQKLPKFIYIITNLKYYSSNKLDPYIESVPEVRLSAHRLKEKQRLPFAKNFFLGQYDVEFAAFPEPQTHERFGEFCDWLKPIEDYAKTNINSSEIDATNKIPDYVIEELANLGAFRAAVPDAYKGLDLNASEYAKLVETVSCVPVIGAYLSKRAAAVNFIKNYASDEQKITYLPNIATGVCHPTICISEDVQGSNGSAVLSIASRSKCDKYWVLNGTKTYVANAINSNLFIVFAECSEIGSTFRPEDTISAFFVERDAGGITISPPCDTLGLRGLSLCQVSFKDTHIPRENIIGKIGSAVHLFAQVYGEGKQNIGSQAIGLTKKFLNLLVNNLKKDKDFNSIHFKNEAIQEVIGKLCCSIYGMESVVYLTTGMMDNFVNQDCDVEKCIVESFCADACIQSILNGIYILGLSSHIKGNDIEQLVRDAICLASYDGSLMDTKSVISLLGIQHIGGDLAGEVNARRNPWMHPGKVLLAFISRKKINDLFIDDHLHPSLKTTAKLLEYGINLLQKSIKVVVVRSGQDVMNHQMELRRITEAVAHLYVMAAIISRASRSYCLGLRDSEKEIKIAQVYGYILHEKAEQLMRDVEYGDWVNGDCLLKEIANSAFEKNNYFVEHPLARNF